jgi:hypothetical protein
MVPVPKLLPEWFLPLTKYRYGLKPLRPKSPKPPPKWVFQEWARFDVWNAWKDGDVDEPRPAGLWTKTPRWAWVLRKALLAKQAKPKPPLPSQPVELPNAGLTNFFAQPGIYLYSAINVPFDKNHFAQLCVENGVEWVAFLRHEGNRKSVPDAWNQPLDEALRAAGVKVCGWGSVFGDVDEGKVARAWAERDDGYIINCEAAYKLTGPGGEQRPDWFLRADQFAKDFGQMPAGKAGAISTLVNADVHFRPLYDSGFHVVHPQTYTNEMPHLSVKLGLDSAMSSVQHDFPGWQKGQVNCTVASYGLYKRSLAEYDPEIREPGMEKQFSHYSGEFLTDADFDTWRSLAL